VRGFYTEAARQRGITLSSAWRANGVPVAEYAEATIILALKKFWRLNRMIRVSRKWERPIRLPGAFRTTVGLLSLGAIGRMVAERLHHHDLEVIAHDPYVSEAQAAEMGVRWVSLEDLFSQSDVISIHTPNLPATQGLVSGPLLHSLKPGASLINTARGQVIDEDALVEVLRLREDLDAILDVTATEPDNGDSPLWDLPNVVLTPHIAGSVDYECRRMGEYMAEEWERYRTGRPLEHEVTEDLLQTMA
jgi:phosphoglycerate dehydrogenase-like enzyme